jgi:SAM-dependent methyltransferase
MPDVSVIADEGRQGGVTQTLAGAGPGPGHPVSPAGSPYWSFYERVAAAQLAQWLPHTSCRVLDLSDGTDRFGEQLLAAGHHVVQAVPAGRAPARATPAGPDPVAGLRLGGSLQTVVADLHRLTWLGDGTVDAVLAESRVLSTFVAAELTVADVHRVLRPGGRLLLTVDSLATGLARLAEQSRWAELADVPSADVLLVQEDDGSVTRCFWPEELKGLLVDAGFEVEWLRPRSVLSPPVVERALATGGEDALRLLVRTECALAAEQDGESVGLHLVASARRPG